MKKELLEHLVRQCVREVLKRVNEGDPNIKGAAAPPADGQGTADQLPIPNEKPIEPLAPTSPETILSPELKGIVIVNPINKSKLTKVTFKANDDISIKNTLTNTAYQNSGRRTNISPSVLNLVKDTIKNPNTKLFLYIGIDPISKIISLMADKSLQIAKDNTYVFPTAEPSVQTPVEVPQQSNSLQNINELKKVVSKMVNEILDRK